ncbi:MAG: polyribonucleotide nucleotidyltransferase [Candidatus Berkelbacteria bacterium]|nr:MAG: polyribonucleotide nucleotidyltransferase [Candidatus Berkelbacteria bacterium]QQG51744.1 MAG: polyribonucleotide nucleotidyltransferase [Candidatus Berkelbacteria bacterium]
MQVKIPFGSEEIVVESGKLAKRASGAVTVTWGETVILVTATIAKEAKEGTDFFPLTVDYEERMYAAGKISGSKFMKRENKPSDEAVLKGRLIDRAIRPMFPKSFRRDVQIIVTTLSYDEEHDPAPLAVIGASAALLMTDAPFEGPIAAVRVGLRGDEFILNPTGTELADSNLDLVAAGSSEKINMIEAASNEVREDKMIAALAFAQKSLAEICQAQREFASSEKEKVEYAEPEFYAEIKTKYGAELAAAVTETDYDAREAKVAEVAKKALEEFAEKYEEQEIKSAVEAAYYKAIRALIIDDHKRPDGRAMDEVRALSGEVGLLPRVHGSALFSRGETSALTLTTLGSPSEEQWIDTMEEFAKKRYIHHYNFPPYSTGEVRRLGTGRREIGHGALAEKALVPVIPAKEEFPYTIRVVTEIMSSNGSTSMAAVVGSTLSLMDAGVPIKKPVAGIAMGLVSGKTDDDFEVLTDLQGLEDFAGEMDFKIAGTREGITAIQLDVKNKGLSAKVISATFEKALTARMQIMDLIDKTMPEPRKELSKYAPRIIVTKIDPEKIGELIGPGGKTINKIIDNEGGREVLNIDIDDDGTVMITSADAEKAARVKGIVESIGIPLKIGDELEGEIVSIVKDRTSGKEIGAIVQLGPNKDGMIHVSALGNGQFVERVSDVVKVGDVVKVRVKDVDPERGRISLTKIN